MRRSPLLAFLLPFFLLAESTRAAAGGAASIEGSIENRESGARLALKGTAPKWPDGAKASVKLSVKDGADIDWYDLTVKGGAFEGAIDFAGKKTAPVIYKAELWLRVGIQLPEIKAWFQREYAVSKDHATLVEVCEVASGTPEERRKFRVETVKTASSLLARARSLLEKAAAAVEKAKDAKEWPALRAPLDEQSRKLQQEYLDALKPWVSLGPDAKLLFSVNDVTLAAFRVLASAEDDAEGARATADEAKAAAEKVSEAIEKTRSELEESGKDGKSPDKDAKDGRGGGGK